MGDFTLRMKSCFFLMAACFWVASHRCRAQSFSFDFAEGYQGWTGGFADYPVADSVMYQLEFGRATLPLPLDTGKFALRISGNNHSDDLFMFIKKKITGLQPGTAYQLRIDVELASRAPTHAVGVGGPPGEGVTLKAGAVRTEPLALDAGGFRVMNLDKANQSVPGPDMDTIGHVGVSDTTTVFTLISRSNATHLFTVTTGSAGEVWVCIGTDSGFESTTTLFYNRISLVFSPAAESAGLHSEEYLRIFPNPAGRYIQLQGGPRGNRAFRLVNMQGKTVFGPEPDRCFPHTLPSLPSGIYTLELEGTPIRRRLVLNP